MFLKRLLMAAAVAAVALPAAAFEPSNVECIAPANPGGGWDFTCRTVGRILQEESLVPGAVQVTNMPGAVGAVAFANVASKRNDDPNLIVATSTVGITQIAQGKYPAGIDQMRWLGMLGADVGTMLVNKESKYDSLDAVLAAVKEDPAGVVVGGSSSIGGWDHLRFLILAQEAGVPTDQLKDIRWVEFSGGADAVTQLLGGHIDVVLTDIGEIGGFIQSGDAKALAVMSDERLPAYPDIATAKEQGIDAVGYNWRGFYMGGGVPDDAYDFWVEKMKALYDSEGWQTAATESGLTPIWRGGEEFNTFVRESEKKAAEISKAIGVIN
ncbi:putative tricarboxylate transport protein TctC [Aurantimonas manganoxydans SI85-9A1]|uniref:Putative tricarboxylate transport protein TctC n=1 Tax=Aurantimonas manganoxydans (strain ATCC BAA-1229 / DSM 21871 / SI85-9A1) TaxID=287752 RepID=Q1YGG9_AURMS|nr:tripartite tricarboxylate transporter substrate-binding protein [Aurantimonas manganoxydans]EAS49256.1 putative tricarboxylate transport protein TctC [Aurantimonas manganoxydans SI85-9A1]